MISFTLAFFLMLFLGYKAQWAYPFDYSRQEKRFDPFVLLLNFILAVLAGSMAQLIVTAAVPHQLVATKPQTIQNFTLSQPVSECSYFLGTGNCRYQQYYEFQTQNQDQVLTQKRIRLYSDVPVGLVKDQSANQYQLVTHYYTYRYDWSKWFGIHNYHGPTARYEFHLPVNWQP